MHGGQHTKNVDFWNLGILLYQLLVGFLPFGYFNKERPDELFNNIQKNKPNLPHFLSDDAKDLITQFLQTDAHLRLGAQSFHDIWCHPFFKGVDWTNLKIKKVESPIMKYLQTTRSICSLDEEYLQQQAPFASQDEDVSAIGREDAQGDAVDLLGFTTASAPEIDECAGGAGTNKRDASDTGGGSA